MSSNVMPTINIQHYGQQNNNPNNQNNNNSNNYYACKSSSLTASTHTTDIYLLWEQLWAAMQPAVAFHCRSPAAPAGGAVSQVRVSSESVRRAQHTAVTSPPECCRFAGRVPTMLLHQRLDLVFTRRWWWWWQKKFTHTFFSYLGTWRSSALLLLLYVWPPLSQHIYPPPLLPQDNYQINQKVRKSVFLWNCLLTH